MSFAPLVCGTHCCKPKDLFVGYLIGTFADRRPDAHCGLVFAVAIQRRSNGLRCNLFRLRVASLKCPVAKLAKFTIFLDRTLSICSLVQQPKVAHEAAAAALDASIARVQAC